MSTHSHKIHIPEGITLPTIKPGITLKNKVKNRLAEIHKSIYYLGKALDAGDITIDYYENILADYKLEAIPLLNELPDGDKENYQIK